MGTTTPLFIISLVYSAALVVRASHILYPELQSLEAKQVDKELRTGYHFQPPKHWINGM
jgi:beta-fructofuranosidase